MTGLYLNHYLIEAEIGRGGMGIVYRATDTKLNRTVAVKVLPATALASPDDRSRFLREAQSAAQFNHPNVCHIYQVDEAVPTDADGREMSTDGSRLFIAMEYIEGNNLREHVQKGPLQLQQAVSIASQLAEALREAHSKDIVHRDIKSANIMLTEGGVAKVLDFGLAKTGQSTLLTRMGSTMGTVAYMAPEQARGEEVDGRSDLYSLGVVLYELLTGVLPFSGDYEQAVLYSILNESPEPLTAVRTGIPMEVERVVNKLMSKQVAHRYQTAADLLADLWSLDLGDNDSSRSRRTVSVATSVTLPSVRRVTLIFALAAIGALALVYTAMILMGLPDWVFPAAVVLVLIGLPIVLFSATVEKQRARMGSGEQERLSGLRAWLSTRLAFRGGLLAGAALFTAVVGYTGLRAAGIGPFASLITSGVLDEQGTIIVVEFENGTGVADLGSTVAEALRIDLSQSTAIQVMDHATMRSGLERMELNPDTAITANLGLRLARREGVKAIVEGDVAAVGSAIQIAARLLSSETGAQLAAVRESAQTEAEALAAIDRLSARLRETIGESLVTIRGNPPLEQVTTRSIEALRHYTRAQRLQNEDRLDQAVEAIQLAIAADSTFGMAYRKASALYTNADMDFDAAMEMLEKAFSMRDRMTKRERLTTEGTYWLRGPFDERDEEAGEGAYEELLRQWPDDITALNNLANYRITQGRIEEAQALYGRALEVQEGSVWRENYTRTFLRLGQVEEHQRAVDEFVRLYPLSEDGPIHRRSLSFALDSMEATHRWMDIADDIARSDGNAATVVDPNTRVVLFLAEGRFEDARAYTRSWLRGPDRRDYQAFREEPDSMISRFPLFTEWDIGRTILLVTGDPAALDAAEAELNAFFGEREAAGPLDPDGNISFENLGAAQDSLRRGNLLAADALLAEVDSLREAGHVFARDQAEERFTQLHAYVNGMLGRDPISAAATFELTLDPQTKRPGRKRLGELWEAAGDQDRAIQAYTQFVSGIDWNTLFQDRGEVALVQFRLGELHEEAGNLDSAIVWYSKMADRWKNADAILQPQVTEARRRIEALLDRKAQEAVR